jgi:HSP20 family protein
MGESYRPLVDSSHFLGRSSFDIPWHALPPTNISKQDKNVVLDISVPGFRKDELEITVKGNTLTVKGKKPHHVEKTGVEYIVEEFSMDTFERKFKLADELCAEHMEAKCENGLLRISFSDKIAAADKKPHHVKVD